MKIVNDLDFRPAMVMVQVLIAEVSLSDDFEFGVELGLQDSLLFNRNLAPVAPLVAPGTPGFNFNGVNTPNNNNFAQELLAGRAVSNFAMGTASGTTGYGGLVLSAASESVNILVRALQDAGRLQILSRPQVMTLDNEPAFVQVGQRVARITGSSTNAQAGGTSNSTVDVDVGLLLRIQPRVNTDGVVVMTLDAERSTVGDPADGTPVAVTPGGQAVNSPPINTTTAQTTVSAKSGQTIVFAGLIQKSKTIASRRVPYVSDIPVLGRLFRFDAESEMRSELLIILTPHIIDDDQDIEWMNYTESDRMSWCFADVVEMHGYAESLSGGHGLWGPPSAPTIYPDLTPTADLLPGTVLEAEPIDV
ncbi:MAG: hypothetical protein KDA47_19915, partial [Planctomycetales bacterium]|nr:hypothetical protein [Planctomycetales bacterium]